MKSSSQVNAALKSQSTFTHTSHPTRKAKELLTKVLAKRHNRLFGTIKRSLAAPLHLKSPSKESPSNPGKSPPLRNGQVAQLRAKLKSKQVPKPRHTIVLINGELVEGVVTESVPSNFSPMCSSRATHKPASQHKPFKKADCKGFDVIARLAKKTQQLLTSKFVFSATLTPIASPRPTISGTISRETRKTKRRLLSPVLLSSLPKVKRSPFLSKTVLKRTHPMPGISRSPETRGALIPIYSPKVSFHS
jgi:hypothetical protein